MTNWLQNISYNEYLRLKADELLVIPVGDTASRPSGATLEPGILRINTDVAANDVIEWWDGAAWRQPTGVDTNFATSDLTFDGDHYHDLAGYEFQLYTGVFSNFTMNSDGIELRMVDDADNGKYAISGAYYDTTTDTATILSLAKSLTAGQEASITVVANTTEDYIKLASLDSDYRVDTLLESLEPEDLMVIWNPGTKRLYRRDMPSGSGTDTGSAVYVVAASDAPTAIKNRADYVCDGTADEVQINTALALGSVQLTQGTFYIAASITPPSNRLLKGSGPETVLVNQGLTGGFVASTTANTMIRPTGTTTIEIMDMTLDGDAATDAAYGIRCSTVGSGEGNTATNGVMIKGVWFANFTKTGIQLEFCMNNLITGCKFTNVRNDGITITRTATTDRSKNTLISNNIFNGGLAAVFVTLADKVFIEGNICNDQTDITFQIENSTEVTVRNNTIKGYKNNAVYFQTGNGALIHGNYIYDGSGTGADGAIAVYEVPNTTISNNRVDDAPEQGIFADTCDNLVIIDNTVSNCNTTNGGFSAIESSSNTGAYICNNTVFKGTTNLQLYGIRVVNDTNTIVTGNNLYGSGVTGDIQLAGATTGTKLRDNIANSGAWRDLLITAAQYEMSTSKILGRTTASQGAIEEITIGSGLTLSAGTLSATGGGSGSVTDFVFTDGNGFDGTVTTGTTVPTLSLTTTVTNDRVMVSNSGAISGTANLTFDETNLNLTGNLVLTGYIYNNSSNLILSAEGGSGMYFYTNNDGRYFVFGPNSTTRLTISNETAVYGANVVVTGTLKVTSLANDDTETKFVVWNSTDKVFEYRTEASLPAGGGGGIARIVVVTSGSATMGSTAAKDYVYFVAGAHTMSLPAAAGNTNLYTVKNNHSAAITIDTVGSETIDGTASIQIAPEDSVDIMSDGTNWFII